MYLKRFTFFMLLISVMAVSCQKDDAVIGNEATTIKTDSAKLATPANLLAAKGTLNITVDGADYTFDASTDSIVMVNVLLDDKKYFGITAINKDHTMSFGVSSLGTAAANVTGDIEGGQLLFNTTAKNNIQYTLSQNTDVPEPGKLIITQYTQDSVLAKGTFTTYLAKDNKPNSAFYKAVGSFSLKLK